MLANRLVHHRLRRRRLVGLVVAMAAIADEIDDDVLVEAHTVFEREPRHEDDCLRIIAVHVEDRRFDHLGDIAAVVRRAASRGSLVVKPTWLLMMMCTVPPV